MHIRQQHIDVDILLLDLESLFEQMAARRSDLQLYQQMTTNYETGQAARDFSKEMEELGWRLRELIRVINDLNKEK